MFWRILNAFNYYPGLPPIKELNVTIQPPDNLMMIGNQPFSLRVTTTGILPIGLSLEKLTKAARNTRTQSDLILVTLCFVEELET